MSDKWGCEMIPDKMKLRIIASVLSILFFPSVLYSWIDRSGEQIRFAYTDLLLRIYKGIEEHEKHTYGVYITSKAALLNREKYSMEFNYPGDLYSIPEGFITISYYSGKQSFPELNEILENELPAGKTGGLRLASMWLKKSAEDRENLDKYHNVINGIMKESDLQWQDVVEYYIQAIRNEIKEKIFSDIDNKKLSVIINKISEPLIYYYVYPSDTSEKKLAETVKLLYKKNHYEGECLIRIMNQFNERFALRIIKRVNNDLR